MYGGAIAMSWLDRPLSVAGRLMVRTTGRVEPRLVDAKKDMLVIPSLCIHQTVGSMAALRLKDKPICCRYTALAAATTDC